MADTRGREAAAGLGEPCVRGSSRDRLEVSAGSPAAGLSHLLWGMEKADGGQSHRGPPPAPGDKGDGGSPVKTSVSCEAETLAREET